VADTDVGKKRPGLGTVLVLISSVCWSSAAVLIKLGLDADLGEIPLNAARLVIGAAVLGLFLLFDPRRSAKKRLPPRLLVALLVFGAVDYGLGGLLFFAAIRYLGASLATLLIFTYPATVVIFSAVLGWEKITLPVASAVLLTFIGVSLVLEIGFVISEEMWIGIAFVFACTLIFTFYLLFCERLLERHSSAQVSFYSLAGGAASMLILLLWFPFPLETVMRPENLLLLATIGVVSTALSLIFFLMGIRHIGAPHASIITTIEPAFVVLLAWLILGETLSWLQLVGVAILLAGVAMARRKRPSMTEPGP